MPITRKAVPKRRVQRADPDARRQLLERASEYVRLEGANSTIRGLAGHLGVTPSNLYYHFPDKDSLIVSVLHHAMQELTQEVARIVAMPWSAPERLHAYVRTHVTFQVGLFPRSASASGQLHSLAVIVGSVADGLRKPIVDAQREFLDGLKTILNDGVAAGDFAIGDVTVTAFAILSLGEHLLNWYRPSGRLSTGQVADQLAALALKMVAVAPSAPPARSARKGS